MVVKVVLDTDHWQTNRAERPSIKGWILPGLLRKLCLMHCLLCTICGFAALFWAGKIDGPTHLTAIDGL